MLDRQSTRVLCITHRSGIGMDCPLFKVGAVHSYVAYKAL